MERSHDSGCEHEGNGEGGSERYVEKRLLEQRTIVLSGEINDRSARSVVSKLLVLDADGPDKPVTLVINSGGGSISSGFAMYDTIRMIDAPVTTVGSGVVASMGVILFLAVPRERRLSLTNARFMIHQPLISGTVVAPASDLEINAREMIKLKERLNQIIAQATGMAIEKVEKDTLRDFWLSAEEACQYGIVGKVIASRRALP
jgi:ATP-dependent Clp protease protease subunit